MASNRRKYLRRTRKARMRELKPSPSGIFSMVISFGAIVLFVYSVILSFQSHGEGSYLVGSMSLLGLGLAIGAVALAIISLRQPKIRPIPAKIGRFIGVIMSILLLALYVFGILF